jgi:hypothetical protein
MSLFEVTSTDVGEFYRGLAVIESGTKWCICQREDGAYLRQFDGQADEVFATLEEALMDCGVLPDDPLEYDSYSDPYDYDRDDYDECHGYHGLERPDEFSAEYQDWERNS